MRELAAKMLDAASELSADVVIIAKDADDDKLTMVAKRIESFLGQIRVNEHLETFMHRRDEPGQMTLLIGMSDHEAKGAIVKALEKKATREAHRDGVTIWTKGKSASVRIAGGQSKLWLAFRLIVEARDLMSMELAD